ncbi:MAG: alpha/beta hydrolase [Parvibaculum sp.]|uniref:alpha/beta fold hydrolase n=1 Tax=Parvibaculum sp. TaxID=2024848 RepID=UPI003C75E8A4
MKYFDSDGLKLAYRMVGEGSPIVLVHGFASTHEVNWVATGWSRALVDAGRRVIMPDGRGHGASDKPHDAADYTLEAMAGDVIALMDHLGEPGVDLMGYSMGGMVSLVAAATWPERFDRVIAAGVGERLLDKDKESASVVDALLTDDPSSIHSPGAKLFRTFADQNKQDHLALAACFEAVRDDFPADSLARITRPVLIVAGETDDQAGPAAPLAARIPGATSFTVPKRDHMRTVGDHAYKDAVLKFLEE